MRSPSPLHTFVEKFFGVYATNERTVNVDLELQLRAFRLGFAAGADSRRTRARHVVDPATHHHWVAGYDAGRDAVLMGEIDYGRALLRPRC